MHLQIKRPSAALIVAFLALLVAITGTAYAVSSSTEVISNLGVKAVVATGTVAAGGNAVGTAHCPSHSIAFAGGGLAQNTAITTYDSIAVDDLGGWEVGFHNPTGESHEVQAEVICVKPAFVKVVRSSGH